LIPGLDGALFSPAWREQFSQGDKQDKRKFKTYPIGYFHVDIAEVRTQEGGL
jgi:hypothetical protein